MGTPNWWRGREVRVVPGYYSDERTWISRIYGVPLEDWKNLSTSNCHVVWYKEPRRERCLPAQHLAFTTSYFELFHGK